MNEINLENKLNELAEINIPLKTNVWPSLITKLYSHQKKEPLRVRRKLLKPTLLILTSVIFLFSIPSVRAYFEEIIGGAVFNITGEYPSSVLVRTVPTEFIPIEQILDDYPFEMPTYAPAEYELIAEARVTEFYDFEPRPSIQLTWDDGIPGTGHIFLNIHHNNGVGGERVGPESLETIEIAGQEVALITGGWYQNTQEWNYDLGYRLKWEKDDLLYSLSYPNTVLFEEITKMVGSMLD